MSLLNDMGLYAGVRIVENMGCLERIGDWLPEIRYTPHRSQRIWKKLMRGTKKRRISIRPMMQPTAYMLGNGTVVCHPSIALALRQQTQSTGSTGSGR